MTIGQQQDASRAERLAEVGSEPPCPFCQRPRVKRSSYIRCNPCGLNWGKDQATDRHPLATQPTASTTQELRDNGAPTAKSTSEVIDGEHA